MVKLEVRNMTVDRGRTKAAIQDVALTLDAGELCFVIGPNGAGKSSLLRALAALDRPRPGAEVLFDGAHLLELRTRERARLVSWMGQASSAPRGIRVRELVASARYARHGAFSRLGRPDQEAIDRAIEAVDLGALQEAAVADLSGGEFERALLARSLAQEASMMLLDEPASALDPVHRLAFARVLREQVRASRGVAIVSTHDLNLAAQCADSVVLLAEGKIRAHGPIAEVYRESELAVLYGDGLFLGRRWSEIAGEERPWVLAWQ